MNTEAIPMYGWKNVGWTKVERTVFKLQKRIFQAEQRGDVKLVRKLQKLLLKSYSAKLLATRRVTQDNQGKKTAGIDGVKALKPHQRLELAVNLKLGEEALPTRRVWIPKPGSEEKRPLGIPVIHDRARQALVKLALEPQWEARFEPNSYGFRPGRSSWDAITAIHTMINLKAKYVLDADIAKCFDRIDHQALLDKLNTFPRLRRQIKAWLKAGVMEGLALTPTEEGTPQGGIVSPLLANIALHGMETMVNKAFKTYGNKGFYPPTLVRYADDLVIFHKDREVIEKCQQLLSDWLAKMGLELKPSKTRLTHTLEQTPEGELGFNFLGFHIRQYPVGKYKSAKSSHRKTLGFKTIIKPSKEGIKRHYQKIKEVVDRHRSSKQLDLMVDLIPVIWGWAGYYRTVSSKKTFTVLDSRVYYKLYVWARRRHPLKSRSWVYQRYWRKINGKGIAFTLVGSEYRLRLHAEMPIERHIKVQGSRSPFDGDWLYWSSRLGKHPQVPARVAKLLKRQKGKCHRCGLYFTNGDKMEVDHIISKQQGGKDSWLNLQLLHRHCHDQKTALNDIKVVKVR